MDWLLGIIGKIKGHRLYVIATGDDADAAVNLAEAFALSNPATRIYNEMRPHGKTGAEIDVMVRRLKLLARSEAVPVVLLVRLAVPDSTKRPALTDLPGTWEVEAHADIVIAMHGSPIRPIVIKNRHGAISPHGETEKGPKILAKR